MGRLAPAHCGPTAVVVEAHCVVSRYATDRSTPAEPRQLARRNGRGYLREVLALAGRLREADARTRTGDPFITSEVLYQLSYVGGLPTVAAVSRPAGRLSDRRGAVP